MSFQTFRFKQTKNVSFPNQEIVKSLASLRRQIFEFDQQECQNGNVDKLLQLEQHLMNYILQLDQLMSVQINFEIQFYWNDSYEPNKFIQSTSWYYEYACQLYNLGILYCILGTQLQQGKDQLTKSRNAQWTFEKLQQILPYVPTKIIKQHADLQYVHILMHFNYQLAFGYKKISDTLKPSQNIEEQRLIFSFIYEALRYYEQTIRCLIQTKQSNQKKLPPIIYNQLMEKFTNEYALSVAIIDIGLAKQLAEIAKDNPKEQYMGKALGHLERIEKIIIKQFKDFKQQNPLLVSQFQQIGILKREFLYKNKEIYKQPIAKENDLIRLPLKEEYVIKIKPPELFFKQFEDQQQQLANKQQLVLKLIQEITNRKTSLQQKQQDIDSQFSILNGKYNFKFILDAVQSAEQLKLLPSIQLKIDYIKEKGGWKGCENRLKEITLLQQKQGQTIINIKQLIDLQQIKPENANQAQFLLSQQIENFKRITEDMQKRLIEAGLLNQNAKDELQKNKDQFLFLEQNNTENLMASKLQQSLQTSQLYYKKNILTLKQFAVKFENVQAKLQYISNFLDKILKAIDDLGFERNKNSQIDDFLYNRVLNDLDKQIQEYDSAFKSINLQELEEIAIKLQDQQFMAVVTKEEEDVEKSLQTIVEQIQNQEYALQFYEQISGQIESFKQLVESILSQNN